MDRCDALSRQLWIARTEVATNPKGVLSLPRRAQIWTAMNDPADPEASYRHRTYLKIACIRHVQHIWERVLPGHGGIEEMLALTQQLIDRQVDPETAERASDSFLSSVTSKYGAIERNYPAMMIADAARNTVLSACERNPDYDTAEANEQDDDELLPDALETSYAYASAAAGGLNWQPADQINVNARRAFWTWYLDHAIPWALTM
ncbi:MULTISPECIES: Imm5 family immunity protein [Actinomyces]|uniref:Imm5 family immunity protein n=1 Tax=Actinomyces TaxID=1654 RepID=UPI0010A23AB9|nr:MULTISPECIES: Imm5 family immunity protein [Actinomyces]